MATSKTKAPHAKCGAHAKQTGKPCTRPAGWGTDHSGSGRCKMHGGKTPIKHGRYSKIARQRLAAVLVDIEADPDPLNLLPELQLLRAQAMHFLEKSGPSPLVAELLEKAARVVDLIHKHKKDGVVTLATLQRVVEQLGVTVARHVKDPAILESIEREWGTIQLDS
jgi:hypothetical protein